jgi:acetylornithine/N-succinyldiaminopimelate aminotransferase
LRARTSIDLQSFTMSQYEEITQLEGQYLLPTYNRYPVAFERGKGALLFDFEGNKYLDFVAGLGVNALGHSHPRIVKAVRDQVTKVVHLSNLYYNEYQGRLAEKLCQLSGLNRAFFSNSGTEAIEGSIKLARLAGHRSGGDAKSRMVALEGSYHGRTFGAMSLTGQDKYRKGFEPLLEDVTFVPRNDVEALREAVNDNTCAIVLEPIFGEGGILECSTQFLQECRVLADRFRAALIFDEIDFCVPVVRCCSRHCRYCKADRSRIPARCVHCQGGVCFGDSARAARHYFRGRSSCLPYRARVPLHR